MNPILKVTSEFAGIKDSYTIELGTADTDVIDKKHTLRIEFDEGTRYGKVDNKQLETFAIEVLAALGYKVK